jgi:hypothetical protein
LSIRPGATQLTVMPCGASSTASDRVSTAIPVFATAYAAMLGAPRTSSDADRPSVMTRPKRCSRMAGSAARVV